MNISARTLPARDGEFKPPFWTTGARPFFPYEAGRLLYGEVPPLGAREHVCGRDLVLLSILPCDRSFSSLDFIR